VIVFLAVLRSKEKETDVVVTVNYTVKNDELEVDAIHKEDVKDILAWIDGAPGVSDAKNTLKGHHGTR
jgi:hypothetical protein